jgi:hypothetical protein
MRDEILHPVVADELSSIRVCVSKEKRNDLRKHFGAVASAATIVAAIFATCQPTVPLLFGQVAGSSVAAHVVACVGSSYREEGAGFQPLSYEEQMSGFRDFARKSGTDPVQLLTLAAKNMPGALNPSLVDSFAVAKEMIEIEKTFS